DAAAIETAIEIDNARIELVEPKGHCSLERSDWPKSQLVDFTPDGIKYQGERLAYFVDCERARSWHEGGSSKEVGAVVDYQTAPKSEAQKGRNAMGKELGDPLHKHDDSSKGWFELALQTLKGAVVGRYGGDTTLTFLVLGYETTLATFSDSPCRIVKK